MNDLEPQHLPSPTPAGKELKYAEAEENFPISCPGFPLLQRGEQYSKKIGSFWHENRSATDSKSRLSADFNINIRHVISLRFSLCCTMKHLVRKMNTLERTLTDGRGCACFNWYPVVSFHGLSVPSIRSYFALKQK